MAYPTSMASSGQYNPPAQNNDSQYSPSPSPDGNSTAANGQRHHRAYQACEACRERKVKCDMGPVDQPHEPPCAKCKREHKQCVFSSSRKKSPTRRSTGGNNNGNGTNGLKRARTVSSADENAQRSRPAPIFQPPGFVKSPFSNASSSFDDNPVSTVHGQNQIQNRVPRSVPHMLSGPQNHNVTSQPRTAATLRPNGAGDEFRSAMAADLLSAPVASSQDGMQLLFRAVATTAETSGQSPSVIQSPNLDSRRSRTFSANLSGISSGMQNPIRGSEQAAEMDKALEVWSRMRFVRAGWITANEAMDYIEYFYARLAPMSPVVTPDYRSVNKHATLLTEEPVLAMTILAITSRQMPLQGSGSNSRSYNVHDKIWHALRRMIERLLWGQEQFGGGAYGVAPVPVRESKTGLITWKGSLRTLGTIEALLLLTDWQPRALHFPPSGDDENWLVDGCRTQLAGESAFNEEGSSGGVAFASNLEPGWRSDRMSWMLLGLAQSLAFELGVFDNDHNPNELRDSQLADYIRKRRLRRLVLVFVSQTGGRVGIKSMLSPEGDRDNGPHSNFQEDAVDRMQNSWLEIASIMYNANLDIFLSRQQTKDLLDSNRYKDEIEKLTPRMQRWKHSFDRIADELDPTMRTVMLMEYEYARLFINSPSFNKVVETWRGQGPNVDNSTLTRVAEENRKYINEVKEAATNLVGVVLQGFADKDLLRDAPVRTYLRSFAAMVFILKLFSLGNHEASVRKFISLLDHISDAMEVQVVDDVHVSTQIASVVKSLLANVKNSFIRVQKSGVNSSSPSRAHSRQHSPHRHIQRQQPRNTMMHEPRYGPITADTSPDPLADIQARPIAEFSQSTFIPPPEMNNGIDVNGGSMAYEPTLDHNMGDTDWFTLPLDHLFHNSTGQFDASLGGIGDTDFLEVLTGQHNNHVNQWSSNVYPPGHGSGMNGF